MGIRPNNHLCVEISTFILKSRDYITQTLVYCVNEDVNETKHDKRKWQKSMVIGEKQKSYHPIIHFVSETSH